MLLLRQRLANYRLPILSSFSKPRQALPIGWFGRREVPSCCRVDCDQLSSQSVGHALDPCSPLEVREAIRMRRWGGSLSRARPGQAFPKLATRRGASQDHPTISASSALLCRRPQGRRPRETATPTLGETLLVAPNLTESASITTSILLPCSAKASQSVEPGGA